MQASISIPSPSSLALRANLAEIVSSLRRTRPRVPFFRLPAHRVPTLRLYRDLLRSSPTNDIRLRIRELFRANRHWTQTGRTKEMLLLGYKWLDTFSAARDGDTKSRSTLARYDRLLTVRKEKKEWEERVKREMAWQARLRSRPIVTGKWLWATTYHRPMPRLRPQPLHMTMMIKSRKEAYVRRHRALDRNKQLRDMLRDEARFEDGLLDNPKRQLFSTRSLWEWDGELNKEFLLLRSYKERSDALAKAPYPPEMMEMLHDARRNKVINKTRERMRERKGEILPSTILRSRKGPPAHVLAHMSEQEIEEDRAMRSSLSTVGYIGKLKEKHGWRGIDQGEGWDVELGQWVPEEEQANMENVLEDVWQENERRRRQDGE